MTKPANYVFIGFSNTGNTASAMQRVKSAVGLRKNILGSILVKPGDEMNPLWVSWLEKQLDDVGGNLGIVFFCPSYGRVRGQVPSELLEYVLEWLQLALERPIPAFAVYSGNRTFGKDFCAAEAHIHELSAYAGITPPVTLGRIDLRGTSKDIEGITSQL